MLRYHFNDYYLYIAHLILRDDDYSCGHDLNPTSPIINGEFSHLMVEEEVREIGAIKKGLQHATGGDR